MVISGYNKRIIERELKNVIYGVVRVALSIMVLYVGIILGIIAIIFSALSLKDINRNYEQGRGMAIAGLVSGIVGVVLWGALLAIFFLATASLQVG